VALLYHSPCSEAHNGMFQAQAREALFSRASLGRWLHDYFQRDAERIILSLGEKHTPLY
jgi:hypothetical protein